MSKNDITKATASQRSLLRGMHAEMDGFPAGGLTDDEREVVLKASPNIDLTKRSGWVE